MKYLLIVIIASIISHLGKNPKKGGNPPKDKRFKNSLNFIKSLE